MGRSRKWILLFLFGFCLSVLIPEVLAAADDTAIINAYQRSKTWWLPDAASSYAGRIDWIFYLILYITGAVFFAVQGLLVYFLVRYRRKEGVKAVYYHGNNRLEIVWTAIPALIMIYLAFASQKTYGFVKGKIPENAFPVEIAAEQFAWNVRYPGSDGKLGTPDDIVKVNQLHVPVDQPVRVKLISISKDGKHPVIHSFFVPEFRIKQDVVPGLPTEIWFQATKTGKFEIACAELCGLGHYRMRGFLTVHTPEGFQQWIQKETAKSEK
ncbi:MAG: cytochrome c oxidase subunit II [Candidatus Omnitrophica bacterium]|nr:cytochrome c oxidase subunit II [Candidatus Omnitrophota bacterium]